MIRCACVAASLVAVVVARRRKQRPSPGSGLNADLGLGKQTRQLVQVYPAAAAATAAPNAGPASSKSHAQEGQQGGKGAAGQLSRSYALSSLLLLLSLALTVFTAVVLVLRGQPDLAAAVAVTWLLAAPAVLALGKQQAATAAASAVAAAVEAAEANAAASDSSSVDATMLITELEPPSQLLARYHGVWIKDAAASDSMDAAVRLVHLNALMRQAVKLIRGVQLEVDDCRFRFAVFSAISWFKLSEFYPWSGEVCENRRRDMRRGRSQGQVHISAKGTICLRYTWEQPYSGHATDEFSIDDQGRLQLYTVVNVGDQTVSYTQVYRRKSQSH